MTYVDIDNNICTTINFIQYISSLINDNLTGVENLCHNRLHTQNLLSNVSSRPSLKYDDLPPSIHSST